MTLDEAIKHSEEVAEEKAEQAWEAQLQEEYSTIKSCKECAEEHRQLAEWLKELKQLREQKPCEDAVSRSAAIDKLKEHYFDKKLQSAKNDPCIIDAMTDLDIRIIKALPPVTPTKCIATVKFSKEDMRELIDEKMKDIVVERKKEEWIPCSERMPEIDEDGYSSYVLVSFSNFTLPCIGQLRKTDGENHWYEGDDEKALDSFGLHVNAWMPLPDPYKAESEDKE